jgi:hypothetical protein
MTEDQIDKAMAVAVAELLRHGGSDTEMLRRQFQTLADDEDNKLTGKLIPS